jgi:PKD repeat protein
MKNWSKLLLLLLCVIVIVCGYFYFTHKPDLPVLSATPSNGAAPLQVTFVATPPYGIDGNGGLYNLNFGDGGNSNISLSGGNNTSGNTTHTYITAGTYNVTLIELASGQPNIFLGSTTVTVN